MKGIMVVLVLGVVPAFGGSRVAPIRLYTHFQHQPLSPGESVGEPFARPDELEKEILRSCRRFHCKRSSARGCDPLRIDVAPTKDDHLPVSYSRQQPIDRQPRRRE